MEQSKEKVRFTSNVCQNISNDYERSRHSKHVSYMLKYIWFLVKLVLTPFTLKLYDFNKVISKFEYSIVIQETIALKARE